MKQRCRNPCSNPLLEPLSALEPSAGTLLEPPLCAGTSAATLVGTPLPVPEALLEPTFVRLWAFLEFQHSVWPLTPWACFGLRKFMGTPTVTLRHCKRVHIVVLVVPKGGGVSAHTFERRTPGGGCLSLAF